MCKAVEDWAEELLTEGKEEGIITTLADLVKNCIITVIQAAEQAKMPVDEFTKKQACTHNSTPYRSEMKGTVIL